MFPIPNEIRAVLAALGAAGHEAYLVGGCTRDFLRGHAPHDYDIATSATPAEMQAAFAGFRTIETGLRHGTLTVLSGGTPVEVTAYRADGPYADRRHPDGVRFVRSLREDLARRDFTMNAIALAPDGALADPFGGEADIAARRIRCVGDPDARFQEDALRMLRALRFASQLGFGIEEDTEQALRRNAPLLRAVSAERTAAELTGLLLGAGAGGVLTKYIDVLGVVLPELLPMKGFEQHRARHHLDVLGHTAAAVDAVPATETLRWAALFHDCGKPETLTVTPDGVGHFYGHAARGIPLADAAMRRLRAPNALRERVLLLIKYHDEPFEESERGARRMLALLPDGAFDELLALRRADTLARAPAFRDAGLAKINALEARAAAIRARGDCLALRDLAVKGGDLLALGFRGEAVGAALEKLLGAVLGGALPNERQALLDAAGSEAFQADVLAREAKKTP